MGTFHQGRSELHGITVVVETDEGDLYVGRCEDEDERSVVLLDADIHRASDDTPRAEYLKKAYDFGFWKRFDRLVLDRNQVTRIAQLGDLVQTGSPVE